MRKYRGPLLLALFVLVFSACTDELPDRKARPEAAQQLLKLRGYEFDEKSYHAAARAGDKMAITAFIDGGINVNAQSESDGHTPLLFESVRVELEVVHLLVRRGADVNVHEKWA